MIGRALGRAIGGTRGVCPNARWRGQTLGQGIFVRTRAWAGRQLPKTARPPVSPSTGRPALRRRLLHPLQPLPQQRQHRRLLRPQARRCRCSSALASASISSDQRARRGSSPGSPDGRSTCGRWSACCRAAPRRARSPRGCCASPPPGCRRARTRCSASAASTVPGPGAEILGGEVAPGDLAQVVVDVGGGDVARLAVLVHVLEQLLPRQFLALPHDARHAAVLHAELPGLAALALEGEAQASSRPPRRGGCAAWSGRSCRSAWRSRRCRRGSAWSPAGARPSPAPSRAAAPAAHVGVDPRADARQGARRTRSCGRTSRRRAPPASAGGSGTACAPCRRGRSPGCGRSACGQIQTSRSRPAGSPGERMRPSVALSRTGAAVRHPVGEALAGRAGA